MRIYRHTLSTLFLAFFLAGAVVPEAVKAAPKPGKQGKPVLVGVARAISLKAALKIVLPGTVLPWARTQIAAEVEGRVEQLYFKEGEFVRKGTRLVQLRDHPYQLQRELAVAQKDRVATQLEELKAGTRAESLDAAKAALQQAQARLKLTQNELKRVNKLYQDGVLSLNEFDNAQAKAEEAQAFYEEKRAVHRERVAGPRIERIRQEEANLQAAEARIRIIEDDITRSTIKAPFTGYVIKKATEVGQWLEKGDTAVTMIVVDPLKVEVAVPQFHFNKIEVGTPAKVILETNQPGEKNYVFKGVVIEKIYAGDPTSRTFPVRIKVKKAHSRMAAGMLVRIELYPKSNSSHKLYVPKDAVVRNPQGTHVWVVREQKDKTQKANKVVVQTGKQVDSLVAIQAQKNQIREGDWVVVQGNERLRPNANVRIIKKFQ